MTQKDHGKRANMIMTKSRKKMNNKVRKSYMKRKKIVTKMAHDFEKKITISL